MKRKFSTTIKEKYWKQKMQQYEQKGYFYEYKECKPYWNKRIENLKLPADAVFLVGAVPYKAKITEILRAKIHHIPEEVASFFYLRNYPQREPKDMMTDLVRILKCEDVRAEREVEDEIL